MVSFCICRMAQHAIIGSRLLSVRTWLFIRLSQLQINSVSLLVCFISGLFIGADRMISIKFVTVKGYYPGIWLEELKKTLKSLRIAIDSAKIGSRNLPNTNQKCNTLSQLAHSICCHGLKFYDYSVANICCSGYFQWT